MVVLWPVLQQQKQWPSLIHLACSVEVSFDRLTLSMSMALGSLWGQEKEVEG